MDDQPRSAKFSIGDKVRVCDDCWHASIRGAVGVISAHPEGICDKPGEGVFWVEFDPWIESEEPAHPIEACEIDGEDLEPLEYPREAC